MPIVVIRPTVKPQRVLVAGVRDILEWHTSAACHDFRHLNDVTGFLSAFDRAAAFEFLFGSGRELRLNVLVSGVRLSDLTVGTAVRIIVMRES